MAVWFNTRPNEAYVPDSATNVIFSKVFYKMYESQLNEMFFSISGGIVHASKVLNWSSAKFYEIPLSRFDTKLPHMG